MNMLVRFGESGDDAAKPEHFPHHLIVDRSFVHGTPKLELKRCITLNSAHSAVVDSWLTECHGNDGDSQAVLGYNGTGPLKIQNNSSRGGTRDRRSSAGATRASSASRPSDIEVRGNHMTRPPSWKKVWQVKNLFETKNVRRLLVEGNVHREQLVRRAERLRVRAQVGEPGRHGAVVELERHHGPLQLHPQHGQRFNLSGTGSNGHKVVTAARIHITHNVAERINVGQFTGEGIAFQLINGISDAIITHNTIINQNATQSTVVFDGAPAQRLVMHSNVFFNGRYGVHGTGGGGGDGHAGEASRPARCSGGTRSSARRAATTRCDTVCPPSMMNAGFVSRAPAATTAPGRARSRAAATTGATSAPTSTGSSAATRGAVVAP